MTIQDIAIAFLKMAGSGEVESAFYQFVNKEFIHHNPYFKGDRESLLIAMQQAHRKSPNKSIEVKQSFVTGSTVVTHSLVTKHEMAIAVVHIFRFEENKIVELWDIGQVIDPNSPNKNGMF